MQNLHLPEHASALLRLEFGVLQNSGNMSPDEQILSSSLPLCPVRYSSLGTSHSLHRRPHDCEMSLSSTFPRSVQAARIDP